MTGSRLRPAILAGLFLGLTLAATLQGVQGDDGLDQVPSEAQCRPYIEKALKDLGPGSQEQEQLSAENEDAVSDEKANESAAEADDQDDELGTREKREASDENETDGKDEGDDNGSDHMETVEITSVEGDNERESVEQVVTESGENESTQVAEDDGGDSKVDNASKEDGDTAEEEVAEAEEQEGSQDGNDDDNENATGESHDENNESEENKNENSKSVETNDVTAEEKDETVEENDATIEEKDETVEEKDETVEDNETIEEKDETVEETHEKDKTDEEKDESVASIEDPVANETQENSVEASKEVNDKSAENSIEVDKSATDAGEASEDQRDSNETTEDKKDEEDNKSKEGGSEEEESTPEEELINEIEIPEVLRPREHVNQLLKLDEENEEAERAIEKIGDIILRDLKRVYDNAIQPLETLYKYRDLSNRHFGDPEIFSKPLVLFMGPWSGGKSTIINYLLDMEFKQTSLRTGAEPSPAYFNILMHGDEEEILDGTQLAADWTFSGLQKFGQGLLDRLKGYRLKSKLLEKVNIVEIPGILEIRKQVQRLFPFNDACQWFIDRADIIFLVYDPAKLDVGPETEAILDQLKGREYQTRIILNKADQVKPEELMRVQGALIWNISPLMSSAEPPVMYSTSLWSMPYEAGAPTRLLYAQERAFLRDLRTAIDKRVEHKIASARRFAVRVRNHAKMVDCYLTTYYNQKTFFANKKDISDKIIENPQDYHIYEGLSTLTNISRYDLPDPDVYRDFFRLNPLYNFPLLSTTCTYFRGCPINRLDVAIAYDFPELVGKYKKSAASHLEEEHEPVRPSTPSGAPRATMS